MAEEGAADPFGDPGPGNRACPTAIENQVTAIVAKIMIMVSFGGLGLGNLG